MLSIGTGEKGAGNYTNYKAEGSIGHADAKADGRIYTGGRDKKYGFAFELGAKAATADGELEAEYETKYFAVKRTVGGSAGSVGASAGMAASFDSDDWVLEVKISGEIAAIFGLKGSLSFRLGDYASPDGLQGLVSSGTPVVIIGE